MIPTSIWRVCSAIDQQTKPGFDFPQVVNCGLAGDHNGAAALRRRPCLAAVCSQTDCGLNNTLPESTNMSVSSRRQKIERMLSEEPQDIFLRYSLAMECAGDGELEQALQLLKTLCDEAPPYVPAFFRSAQLLADADQVEAARGFLREGIEAARAQGDLHAAAEMGEMLADLGSAS